MTIRSRRLPLVLLSLGLCACPPAPPPAGDPGTDGGIADGSGGDAAAPDLADPAFRVLFSAGTDRDLDVLFLMDSSLFMAPKQRAFIESVPRLVRKLDDSGANYHLGVTTPNIGTFIAAGQPWSVNIGSCNSFEGDDGTLQRIACKARTGMTADAVSACNAFCPDDKFVPGAGQGFIERIKGVTNVPKDVVMGVDLGPQRALQCIGLVGDAGCGVEGQLEGMKRALDGHNPMNNGFLRPGSVLALVLLTDEDDCSVSMNRRFENDPVSENCPTGDKNARYSCFNLDYRCLARDLVCNEPMNTPGVKTGCHERGDVAGEGVSYLEKVESYVSFFKALRPANKLLVTGIWALPRVGAAGSQVVIVPDGSTRSDGLNRGKDAMAACVSATDPNLHARPQLRLSKFAEQFTTSAQVNICDTANYAVALDAIGSSLQAKVNSSCLPMVPRTEAGAPRCTVGDIDARTLDARPATPFPVCSAACCQAWAQAAAPSSDAPAIQAACASEAAAPCYCALPSQAGACAGGVVFGVVRKGAPPADKVIVAECAGP